MGLRSWLGAMLLTLLLLPWATERADGLISDPALEQLQQEFNQAIAVVRPSVVGIRAVKRMNPGQSNASFLYESIGSGFIVDARGYVLTNHHVVEDASNIAVNLWRSQGNNEYSAQIVDADRSLDLALLKLNSNERFIPVKMGNSDQVKLGDWILSVGSPFGFGHTVTLGIVSDKHRDLVINGVPYQRMLQTDAMINQGNSGGPLLDVYGRVIAVGTAIYAPNGTSTGVAFAIPINRARHFITLTTGAMTAAATAPVNPPPPATKEAINLNDRIPQDATHEKFGDCTVCHTITKKSVVNLQAKMTHPMVGACDTCHIVVNEPVRHGPTPVAAVIQTPTPGDGNSSPGKLLKFIVLGTLAALVIAALFTLLSGLLGGQFPWLGQRGWWRFLGAFVVSMVSWFAVVGVFFL